MKSESRPEGTRANLWNAMLDAEMNVYYWTEISGRMTTYDRILKFVVAITSSGTAIAAWTIWKSHPEIWRAVTAFSSLVSVYHTFFFSSERLKKSSTLVGVWRELAHRYRLLWMDDSSLVLPKSMRLFEKEKEREIHVDETLFKRDVHLVKKAQLSVRKARGLI